MLLPFQPLIRIIYYTNGSEKNAENRYDHSPRVVRRTGSDFSYLPMTRSGAYIRYVSTGGEEDKGNMARYSRNYCPCSHMNLMRTSRISSSEKSRPSSLTASSSESLSASSLK